MLPPNTVALSGGCELSVGHAHLVPFAAVYGAGSMVPPYWSGSWQTMG